MILPTEHRLLAVTMLSTAALALSACDRDPPPAEPEVVAEAMSDDGDLISLAGTVVSTSPSTFLLDYGNGRVTVEFDDWDFFGDASALAPGDRVEVTGRVDENLYMANTIEAGSVYVDNLDTHFFASAADEEAVNLGSLSAPGSTPSADYTGWVTGTSDQSFTLGAGPTKVTVDMTELDSPLTEDQIAVGDRVYVWGDIEISDEGMSKFVADGVVELVTSEMPIGGQGGSSSET